MDEIKKKAFQLILLLGIVSLLGDIIYEGGRSVNGQYFKVLGVSAAKVGFVVGVGEFLGCLFRLISGFFGDKLKSYWFLVFLGYSLLASIPLISLTESWEIVAFLIILERIGKGIRAPARDAIVSFAGKQVGRGLGFGIAEFLDQIGAIVGPLIFTILFLNFSSEKNIIRIYQKGYSFFWLPFVILVGLLFYGYLNFRKSEELEGENETKKEEKKIINFWLYILFIFITTLGFINFSLIGFHFKNYKIIPDSKIPLFYTLAMTIDATIALVVGKVYDRLKRNYRSFYFLLLIPIFTVVMPFLVFSNKFFLILWGIIIFGFISGIQETTMRAIVADISAIKNRSGAYGLFNFFFGFAYFLGSLIFGFLYEHSISFLLMAVVIIELLAILLFCFMIKKAKNLKL